MAFQMIHMETAYRLLEKWPWICHPGEFILGSAAPDSVHMRDDFVIDMKVKTHLYEGCGTWGRVDDYDRWMDNIIKFWKSRKGECVSDKEKCFLAGVCVHCLTDYYNDINIWNYFLKQHVPPMKHENFKEAFYEEARGMDLWLFQNSPHTVRITSLLKEGECLEFKGFFNAAYIEKQKRHMLEVQYVKPKVNIEDYRFLSEGFIESFLNQTVYDIDTIYTRFLT